LSSDIGPIDCQGLIEELYAQSGDTVLSEGALDELVSQRGLAYASLACQKDLHLKLRCDFGFNHYY
jgi:hypothetical protein